MHYWKSYLVNLEDLIKQKSQLINISNIAQKDVMDVWRELNEEIINDFDNIEYDWSMPLYKKMILRLKREGRNDPAVFIKTLDPSNQQRISMKYGIYDYKIFEFFAYIKNQFGEYQIKEMNMDSTLWKTNDAIKFFFILNKLDQQKFVDMYNKSFDQLIKEDELRISGFK